MFKVNYIVDHVSFCCFVLWLYPQPLRHNYYVCKYGKKAVENIIIIAIRASRFRFRLMVFAMILSDSTNSTYLLWDFTRYNYLWELPICVLQFCVRRWLRQNSLPLQPVKWIGALFCQYCCFIINFGWKKHMLYVMGLIDLNCHTQAFLIYFTSGWNRAIILIDEQTCWQFSVERDF